MNRITNFHLGKSWTTAEESYLMANHKTMNTAAMASALGRTKPSVKNRLQHLGIRMSAARLWTPKEVDRLRLLFGTRPNKELACLLGRSESAMVKKVMDIGVRLDALTQGMETVRAAGIRHNMEHATIYHVIRWANLHATRIGFHPAMSGSRRSLYYDQTDVDEAVNNWTRYDTVASAARRTGWSTTAIGKWLKKEGVKFIRINNARGTHGKVPKEVVDRVVAKYSSSETAKEAAARYGVAARTMRKWLLAAGLIVVGGTHGGARLQVSDVDRAASDRARKETISDAARRHNMSRSVLRNWMIDAGVHRPAKTSECCLFEHDVADRVVSNRALRKAA